MGGSWPGGHHGPGTYTAAVAERPNLSKRGTGGAATPPASGTKPAPPRLVIYAVAALVLSGIAAVLASATLFTGSVKVWVRDGARDTLSNQMRDKVDDIKKAGPDTGDRATQLDDLRKQITGFKNTPSDQLTPVANQIKAKIDELEPGASSKGKDLFKDLDKQATSVRDINDQIGTQQKGALISSIVVFIALGVAAAAAYRGRYWVRWATLGLWVLATFTGTLAGLGSVMSVGADIPGLFKVPAFLSGAALVVAVVLTNLRPSVEYFNSSRPDRGARPQRRGLFAPPQRPAATPADDEDTRPARSSNDRARTKQRSSEAVAKGAELARSRAKASKSRRSGS